MSQHKLPQELREELGLIGIKNRSPRTSTGKWVHQHSYDKETDTWTSNGAYRDPTRAERKRDRAERLRLNKAYAKQYING